MRNARRTICPFAMEYGPLQLVGRPVTMERWNDK